MPALGDDEDNKPLERRAIESRPTLSPAELADEVTRPDLRTPVPARKTTPPPTQESQILQMLQRIERKVMAIDVGLGVANDEISALRGDMNTGFDFVRAMLLGDGTEHGRSIAKDLGLVREQATSALAAISDLPPRLTAIEQKLEGTLRVACTSYDGIFHGPDSVAHEEREACETIRDAARSVG